MIDNKIARTLRAVCSALVSIVAIISANLAQNLDPVTRTRMIVFIGFVLFGSLMVNIHSVVPETVAGMYTLFLCVFVGIIMSATSRTIMVLIIMSVCSSVLAFLSNSKRLMVAHMIITVATIAVFECVPNPWFAGRPRPLEMVSTMLSIFMSDMVFITVIKQNERDKYNQEEQERSTDELLKIIEAKADEARIATKSKSDFLASMSHEIRTPINAVMGMNEMIIREATDETIKGYASDIQSSGNMLLSLVNNVLDFSKIESGKMNLNLADYNVDAALYEFVTMTATHAAKKKLEVIIKVDENIPKTLFGDEVRVKQVITNIISNAIKYTDKGSVSLLIGFDKTDEENINLNVSIADTGRGMRHEDMNKLFAPFERIEELRNRHIEGTGLGMSITQQLLTMMGSKLEVESEYGVGSTFSFTIKQKVANWEPLGDYEEALKKYKSKAVGYKESFTAPDAKVLVVDDIQMNVDVFKNLLKRTQIKVDTALSGTEALALARQNKYDIIFMDHMMPGMDGIETYKKILADRFSLCRETPVIALTANAISGAREGYLENGFADYLSKPVEPKKLEMMVVQYLPEELVSRWSESAQITEDSDISKVEQLKNIPYLDVQLGLSYTGSNENYEMVARDFYVGGAAKMEEIKNLCAENDIKNYTIRVHALKSSARMIGDSELSEMALALEMAGNNEDMDTIKADTEALLIRYDRLLECLKFVFSSNGSRMLPEIEESKLSELADKMRTGLENFDFDIIDETMEELGGYSLPENIVKPFDELKVLVADVELEKIGEWLDKYFPKK